MSEPKDPTTIPVAERQAAVERELSVFINGALNLYGLGGAKIAWDYNPNSEDFDVSASWDFCAGEDDNA